ncbi:substrate-binding domain-containing protein [Botrimarina mediterranea]|uniref:D-ribose-binding periplasmic protein n=1 Tax=Botrimarina mediterranea TaxID=2528022 RepID=A0A518K9H0_9BACT|nr:substrate-binding domain-containing protein [Botrimarina mediterranea]QDV74448.1 D-ribose-binding periplasmic protein precursor [Botrimarina mediterranea]QDV79044.1 D-ribose-binding periplasmic protein precursor [Planctomycetes bacterium K2D]
MLQNKAFWFAVVAAIAAVVYVRSAASPTEEPKNGPLKITFITAGAGEYWDAAVRGAEDAAEQQGITLSVVKLKSPESVEEQMQALSVASMSNANGVAISPIDPERVTPLITQIASIKPVVTYDSDASKSARHGYIGTSNFSAGLVAGTLVKTAIPEGGKIAVFMANETKENLIERQGGLRTRIAESPDPAESPVDPRYTIVGFYPDGGDDEVCKAKLAEVLEEHPDLACVVTLNSRQGPVVLDALQELKNSGQVKMIAFDTSDKILQAIEEGRVFAAVAQDAYKYGYEAVKMVSYLCRGEEEFLPVVGRGAIHISVEPIRQDDVETYRKRIESRRPGAKG